MRAQAQLPLLPLCCVCVSCCSAAGCQQLLLLLPPLFLLLLPIFLLLPFLSASFSSLPSCLSSRSSLSLPSTASPSVAAAGVAGCWGDCLLACCSCFSQGPSSSSSCFSSSFSFSFAVVASPLPWLLLLCRGCSAGAGKGDQRHLDTAKEQTGTRLSTKKRKVRQRISFSCSFVGRALYRAGRTKKQRAPQARSARSSASGRRFL